MMTRDERHDGGAPVALRRRRAGAARGVLTRARRIVLLTTAGLILLALSATPSGATGTATSALPTAPDASAMSLLSTSQMPGGGPGVMAVASPARTGQTMPLAAPLLGVALMGLVLVAIGSFVWAQTHHGPHSHPSQARRPPPARRRR